MPIPRLIDSLGIPHCETQLPSPRLHVAEGCVLDPFMGNKQVMDAVGCGSPAWSGTYVLVNQEAAGARTARADTRTNCRWGNGM